MKNKLTKLIDVKSIMTLLLTLVFCILALCGVITGEQFLTIFVTVVGFYFGTQANKKNTGEQVPEQGPVQVKTAADEAMQNDIHTPDSHVKGE